MNSYWENWLRAAAVRAVKTVAQTAAATIGTAAAMGEVDWLLTVSAAALAGVLSLLTSAAGLPVVDVESAGAGHRSERAGLHGEPSRLQPHQVRQVAGPGRSALVHVLCAVVLQSGRSPPALPDRLLLRAAALVQGESA